jgi:2-methylcitrate dehydratase PrpD
MGWPYSAGNAARNGVTAVRLAELGVETAPTMFEGEKGIFGAFSDEDPAKPWAVADTLGARWRMLEAGYKRYQAETIDQAPLQCTLTLRERVPHLVEQARSMTFHVEPVVAAVAEERYRRFGAPRTDLQAAFDLRYVMAAAWLLGRSGEDVYSPRNYEDPRILALRDRISVHADPAITLDGARLEVEFDGGAVEREVVPAWKGAPGNPFSDAELADLFRATAAPYLAAPAVERILRAVEGAAEAQRAADVARAVVR